MSMYEQDKWQRQGEIEDKVKQLKDKASIENDAILFNAINSYQRNDNDVLVLINIIDQLNKRNKHYEESLRQIEQLNEYYSGTIASKALN